MSKLNCTDRPATEIVRSAYCSLQALNDIAGLMDSGINHDAGGVYVDRIIALAESMMRYVDDVLAAVDNGLVPVESDTEDAARLLRTYLLIVLKTMASVFIASREDMDDVVSVNYAQFVAMSVQIKRLGEAADKLEEADFASRAAPSLEPCAIA